MPKKPVESREEAISDLIHEVAGLVLSDSAFHHLRFMKKAIPFFYDYVSRERRRKRPSKQFQWLVAEMFRSDAPVDSAMISAFRDVLQLMRKHLEGEALPPNSGDEALRHFRNLMRIRREPKYWREYRAYCSGKPVSEILAQFHPEHGKLHGWERDQSFRKVYNGIQRLVEKYGGPPANQAPPASH